MPRTFTLVSVSIHAVVLGGVYIAQTLTGGPLPALHGALAFADPSIIPIKIADIELPRPTPQSTQNGQSVSPQAAPLDAPAAVTAETGRENETSATHASGPVVGVEQNAGVPVSVGVMPGASLPPPPPLAPMAPLRLHSGIQPPRKVADAKPVYPPLAQSARQEGVVILETIINDRGDVEAVHVLRGYPLLDQAAIDAVRLWRFAPALLNGRPVPVVMTVTVNFSLK